MSGTHADDPGAGHGFDESRGGLDLTPRVTATPPDGGARRSRPIAAYLAVAAVVLAIAFVVLQALGDATLYFRNVDEAVEQSAELGDRRFRLQGLVRDDVETSGDEVRFTITFNGVDLPVRHTGDPPDLFQPGQAVVLEGHLVDGGAAFASDRILVKHSEEYEAEHEDRITDAGDGRSAEPG